MTNLSKQKEKQKQISLTQIRNAVKDVVFNPRAPGPMKIISDMDDLSYFELRAIELIQEAREDPNSAQYKSKIIKAMQLLALILCR